MSDSPLVASGFGRVTREVVSRLCTEPGIEVACLGWSHDGWPHSKERFAPTIFPTGAQDQGRSVLERAVDEFQPDLVVTLGELWMLDWLPSHPARRKFAWAAYIPVDGGPFYPPWEPMLRDADVLIAMSEYGRGILQGGLPNRKIQMIPHGVDCSVFRPLENRDRRPARVAGKTVVGCVARNQARKNIPALVAAFARASAVDAKLHLYLHMNPCDVGLDLVTLLHRHRLQGRADVSHPEIGVTTPVPDAHLNEIYNLMDMMVLPTMGEGFGLPILESFAAGIPVIATDCSACSELVQGRGMLARVAATMTCGMNLISQALVDESHLADCILALENDEALRREYGVKARAFAETLDWSRLIPSWLEAVGCAR